MILDIENFIIIKKLTLDYLFKKNKNKIKYTQSY